MKISGKLVYIFQGFCKSNINIFYVSKKRSFPKLVFNGSRVYLPLSTRTKTLPVLRFRGLQSTPKRSAVFLANLRKPTPCNLPEWFYGSEFRISGQPLFPFIKSNSPVNMDDLLFVFFFFICYIVLYPISSQIQQAEKQNLRN